MNNSIFNQDDDDNDDDIEMKNNDSYINPSNDIYNNSVIFESNEISMKNDLDGNNDNNDNNNNSDMNSQDKYVSRELFGGAIITTFLSTFEDISLVRQVPDHQEVYVDRVTDTSLIVELLSYDESISDSIATQHYFQDLAQCNEATEYSIDSTAVINSNTCMPGVSGGSYSCCALVGRQVVAKFYRRADSPLNNVQILLLVLRLPTVGTDILITLNIPYPQQQEGDGDEDGDGDGVVGDGEDSTSATSANIPIITTSSFLSLVPLSPNEPIAVDIMRHILRNFKIVDWSLFA